MKRFNDIIILTIGRVLIMMTSVISIRIFTTWLSPEEIGRLYILQAICGWFSLVLINPVGMYVNRKIIEWNREGLASKNIIVLLEYFVIVAALAIVSIIGLNYSIGLGIDVKMLWIFIIVVGSILVTSGNTSFLGWLNLFGKRFSFTSLTIGTLWMGLAFSTFFVWRIAPKAEYWFAGQLISQGLILVVGMVLFFQMLAKPVSAVAGKDRSFTPMVVFRFAWPLAICTFFYWCHIQGYRFLFQKMVGIEVLGLFTVGFRIGSSLMISFNTLFSQYYQPIFYNEVANSTEQQRTTAWNKYAVAFFPAVIIMVMFIVFNGSLIAKIFTGEKFHSVGNVIFWGTITQGLMMMSSVTTMVSHSQMEMKPLIAPGLIGALTAIIGIFMFVRFNPFIGGGFALAFGSLLALIYLYRNMKKLLPIKFPWKRSAYSLILGIPMIVFFVIMRRLLPIPTTLQSLLILGISGLYLLFIQFILARKWLSLAVKLPIVDNFEQKLRIIYGKVGY